MKARYSVPAVVVDDGPWGVPIVVKGRLTRGKVSCQIGAAN